MIEKAQEAKKAAEDIFDWADNNLSMMEACDMPEEGVKKAKEIFDASKILKELLY